MKKLIVAFVGLALLAACGTTSERTRYDDAETVARAAYRHDGPPALTLYTMVNATTGAGAHTSLMINGSQRVIFDPAGSVQHSQIAERADVLYGITPRIEKFYASAHSRKTHYVVIQRIEVSPEVAEKALQLAINNGAVAQAFCANSTSQLLQKLPGFDGIKTTFYPVKLSKQFGALPGVVTRELHETDDEDKSKAIAEFDAELRAQAPN
ncbi:hypothetical protein Q4577_17150 [Marinovum sp. 2_MG-2023]|uniref:hypothetical protein n=1 Tax=unclassified Marinovum TaxID=2647166 RepID=UPI0026E166B0|nr:MULTISPECIES: hypothetical protein [unclassified Marinovum]MDO6731763.1 hypothetical protein [Marinovum sp. 2_MG-2023]MDO6781015.1 hypothetical protein [Marinovum sp. 1_MG-2023]